MAKDDHLHGANIGHDFTEDWETQQGRLDDSIRLHRPMLILFEVSDRMLHWAVIAGQEKKAPRDYLMLETSGLLRHLPSDELRRRMDLQHHIGREGIAHYNPMISFEQLSRFNSVSCTWYEMPKDFGVTRSYGAHGNKHCLRGDRGIAHNISNTVMDAPIMKLSPIGWLWKAL